MRATRFDHDRPKDPTLTCMDRIFSADFHAATGAEDWRVLPEGAYAFFRQSFVCSSIQA